METRHLTTRRYQRLLGSMISVLAGGMGLIWVFLDQDCLTWHDHISSTFPTISSERKRIDPALRNATRQFKPGRYRRPE